MRSQRAALATLTTLILTTTAAEPPTTGWLYIDRNNGRFIFPFTAAQCESFDIYYNSTVEHIFHFYDSTTPDPLFTLLTFRIPPGVGYVEWICNIPANIAFKVDYGVLDYVVQAGSSSACLGDLNTTYSILPYAIPNFASFTRNPSLLDTPLTTADLYVSFPVRCLSLTLPLSDLPSPFPPARTRPLQSSEARSLSFHTTY